MNGFRLEKDLVKQVKAWLDYMQSKRDLIYRRISTTGIPRTDGRMSKNPAAGMPDFIVWFKGGVCLSLECKSATGKLSPHQEAFKMDLEEMGHKYLVIRTLDELENFAKINGGYVWF